MLELLDLLGNISENPTTVVFYKLEITHKYFSISNSLLLLVKEPQSWILMFCQSHRVTSGQSNCHKQIYISPSQEGPQNQSLHKHITKYITYTNIWKVSPFNITPVKTTNRSRTCWNSWPFHLIYWHQITEKYNPKKEWNNKKCKTVMQIIKCICQWKISVPYGNMYMKFKTTKHTRIHVKALSPTLESGMAHKRMLRNSIGLRVWCDTHCPRCYKNFVWLEHSI